jgi:putative ABC transport system permease protein
VSAPRWAQWLLERTAPPGRASDVLGDVEETHRNRLRSRGRVVANVLTGIEALDLTAVFIFQRIRGGDVPGVPTASDLPSLRGGDGGPRISWLDFKLGFRMLVKHPGLTVVAGLAISFGIALGAGTFEFVTDMTFPTLPLDEGDRVVRVGNWDTRAGRMDVRAIHDFETWRDELTSIEELGAIRTVQENLTVGSSSTEPALGYEMDAAALAIARTPPLLGRVLVEGDAEPGATNVVVLGYDTWQSRFGGDPGVLGQPVDVGEIASTVVGVMPEGFEYPAKSAFWVPLRLSAVDFERGQGPALLIVGRLAPGVTIEQAQAELTTFGLRAADAYPDTHQYLEPRVQPLAQPLISTSTLANVGLYAASAVFFIGLLVLICANVALLLFARTATREREIVVRSALGASRGRIVTQLFAEALVLGAVSAAVGLAGAAYGLRWVMDVLEAQGGRFPFWIQPDLQPTTILYAGLLTLIAAVVAGVVPALKVTGPGVHMNLQRVAGRGSGLKMGKLWTGVIVTQVACTVFFLPIMIMVGADTAEIRNADLGFPAEQYLYARLAMDGQGAAAQFEGLATPDTESRFAQAVREVERRVSAESEIMATTMVTQVPGGWHPRRWIEFDGPVLPPSSTLGYWAQAVSVDPGFFTTFGAPILAGRGFNPGDVGSEQRPVVVNESFVREFFGDRGAVGRHFRYVERESSWAGPPTGESGLPYEIVGVVRDIGLTVDPDLPHGAGVYHPLEVEKASPLYLVMHVSGNPSSFTGQLRDLAAAVDPSLRVLDARTIDRAASDTLLAYSSWFTVIVIAGVLALLLSNAGIYSVMAFTVSRRTREIGVRVALGAGKGQIAVAVFSRAVLQVGAGVAAGTGVFVSVLLLSGGSLPLTPARLAIYAAYVMGMGVVCTLACVVPVHRALSVEPTEALGAE